MKSVSARNIFLDIKSFFSHISIDCLAVCIYFLFMPFTMVSTPFGSLLKLITIPVIGVLGIKLFVGKTKSLQFNSVHLFYGAYVIFTFCQLIYFNEEIARTTTSDMMQAFLVLMLITIRVYNENEQKLIESAWIIVAIICAVLCLTSSEMANEYENRAVIRIFGYEEDQNQFSAYFTMGVVVAMKRIVNRNKLSVMYAALLVIVAYSILRMGSRGGLIGIVAAIVCCVLFGVKSIKTKVLLFGLGILAVVLVVVVFFPLLPPDIQDRYTIANVVESGGSGRTDIWKFCLQYTTEKASRIIWGSGLFSTQVIFPTTNRVTNLVAHNQFIQTFFDQGMIGLFFYLATFASCILKTIKKQPFYASAMFAMMAFSLSLTMYVFKPYINVIMMCALNVEMISETTSKNKKSTIEEK